MTDSWLKYNEDRYGKNRLCTSCNDLITPQATRWWNQRTKAVYCDECYLIEHSPNMCMTKETTTVDNTTIANNDTQYIAISPTPPRSPPSKDERIEAAHAENMEANKMLCLQIAGLTGAVIDLMRVEEDRNKLLRQVQEERNRIMKEASK